MKKAKPVIWAVVAALLLLVSCQGTPAEPTARAPVLRVTIPVLPSPTPRSWSLVGVPGQEDAPTTSDEVPRITPQEVRSLMASGRDVVLVDTRGVEFYEAQHIEGAISMPYSVVDQRYSELPRGNIIVFYCT